MKKYTFSLERVLRVRRTQQDIAGLELRASAARARREQDMAQLKRERYDAAVAATIGMQGMASAALGVRQLAALHASSVLGAQLRVAAAEQTREENRLAWIAAKQRVAALEGIDARQRAEHARATIAHEDAVADDVVTSRHRRPR